MSDVCDERTYQIWLFHLYSMKILVSFKKKMSYHTIWEFFPMIHRTLIAQKEINIQRTRMTLEDLRKYSPFQTCCKMNINVS